MHVDRFVEKIVEVPVDRVVTKEVPVFVDKGQNMVNNSLPLSVFFSSDAVTCKLLTIYEIEADDEIVQQRTSCTNAHAQTDLSAAQIVHFFCGHSSGQQATIQSDTCTKLYILSIKYVALGQKHFCSRLR